MKRILIAALAATTLATSIPVAAYAQPGPPPRGPGFHGDHRPPPPPPPRSHMRRDDGRREWHGQRYRVERYNPPPRYVERHWRRGERLPTYYRGDGYRVDYRRYNLAPPPRGYEYVRVNNDIILAAVATGVISSIITGLMYQ